MDSLPAGLLGIGSGWAIVALTVIALLRGDIVSRRFLDDARHDRDDWKAAHGRSEEGRHEALRQNGDMLEVVHTANHVLSALPPRSPGREVSHAPVDGASAPPQA